MSLEREVIVSLQQAAEMSKEERKDTLFERILAQQRNHINNLRDIEAALTRILVNAYGPTEERDSDEDIDLKVKPAGMIATMNGVVEGMNNISKRIIDSVKLIEKII